MSAHRPPSILTRLGHLHKWCTVWSRAYYIQQDHCLLYYSCLALHCVASCIESLAPQKTVKPFSIWDLRVWGLCTTKLCTESAAMKSKDFNGWIPFWPQFFPQTISACLSGFSFTLSSRSEVGAGENPSAGQRRGGPIDEQSRHPAGEMCLLRITRGRADRQKHGVDQRRAEGLLEVLPFPSSGWGCWEGIRGKPLCKKKAQKKTIVQWIKNY